MCQMLRDGETDIAVILTEGIVKDIVAGNQVKLYICGIAQYGVFTWRPIPNIKPFPI
jgi:hypothetical protein